MNPMYCSKCGRLIKPGESYAYYPAKKKTYCAACDERYRKNA
jgi:NAD-dependent SIR2 family protein deacetylase